MEFLYKVYDFIVDFFPLKHVQTLYNPFRLLVLVHLPPIPRKEQEDAAWDEDKKSDNIIIQNDTLLIVRKTNPSRTDCVLGKQGFSTGIHAWKITWPRSDRGTHAVVGVATDEIQLESMIYENLVGKFEDSWGWDIIRNRAYHDSKSKPYPKISITEHFVCSDDFIVILDMDVGVLCFFANGDYLGVAFDGLLGQILYPVVNCVYGRCQLKMEYMGTLNLGPPSLSQMCTHVIRNRLGFLDIDNKINTLPIPGVMKKYLKVRNNIWN